MAFIQEGFRDTTIIPDKYNTGCDENKLEHVVTDAVTIDNVTYKWYSGGTLLGIDIQNNASIYGSHDKVIENTDFSSLKMSTWTSGDSPSTLTFRNCKFYMFATHSEDTLNIIFENCTFASVGLVSYCTFNNCKFGGTFNDALRPLTHVTFNDCFISDMQHWNDGVYHTDGIQIYGDEGTDAEDIILNNCRFEIPAYPCKKDGVDSTTYVNACLMVQLEYSNGNNIQFNNIIANGGGYVCYSRPTGNCTLSNCVFNSCRFGYSSLYGHFYADLDESETTIIDVKKNNSLYVSSVWKDDNGETHIAVTNDTLTNRKLLVRTNKGVVEYIIPHTYTRNEIYDIEFRPYEGISYADYPIDININLGVVDYVVCYDETMRTENQIRFVNYTGEDVEEIIVDDKCSVNHLVDRHVRLMSSKDKNGVIMFIDEWAKTDMSTTSEELMPIDGVIMGHTYRITGSIEINAYNITPSHTNNYFRLRVRDNGAFGLKNIITSKIDPSSETATLTRDFDITIEATRDETYGRIGVYVDGLEYTFIIRNLKITDVIE